MTARTAVASTTRETGDAGNPMSTNLRALRDTVRDMDWNGQCNFGAIRDACNALLGELQAPHPIAAKTYLADFVMLISDRAAEAQDALTRSAAAVGCNYVDPAARCRAAAAAEGSCEPRHAAASHSHDTLQGGAQ